MSEPVVCPVCETPNDPDNSHCEVCGERLTPPEPGEELSPEENVAAAIEAESEAEIAMEPVDEGTDAEELELEPAAADAGEAMELEPVGDDMSAMESDEEPAGDDVEAEPNVLYSPIDGTAYPEGTPEFEEGFGPNGEELVSELPADIAAPEDATEAGDDDLEHDDFESEDEGDDAGFDMDDEFDDYPDEAEHTGEESADSEVDAEADAAVEGDQTSEQFQQLFTPRPPPAGGAAPLPEPGVRAVPATLTVYVNRQPVHTHAIETDETLIGRRDPVADAYPDLDLTEIDENSVVSRKHAYIFRQNRNYTLYVVSNAGTQLNADLLELGERRPLADGDIIVLAGSIAMKFDLPD